MKTLKEDRLRKKVFEGLNEPTGTFVRAMVIINNDTGEMKMKSSMPIKNNIALLKYIKYKQKNRKNI